MNPMGRHEGLKGWLPVSFTFNMEAVSVRWLEFGATPFSEPFFPQTVRHLRSLRPPARERITDAQALVEYAAAFPSVIPAGVIFHVSRCGSTFLANALRTGDQVVIVSEARAIGTFFNSRVFGRSPFPPSRWADARRMLLDSVVRIYGHHEGAARPRLVIKCNTASMLQMSLLRQVWPDVPSVVIIRDPVEVIVSNLAAPGGWVRARHVPLGGRSMFGWPGNETQQMSDEEYCARGLGRFFDVARTHVDDKCRVIDYEHLNVDHLYEIAEFFGIQMPSADSHEFKEVSTIYAKDPSRTRKFENDRERKHREATDLIRHSAEQWANGPYQRLKQMQTWRAHPVADRGLSVIH